jgi:hypothetical protein
VKNQLQIIIDDSNVAKDRAAALIEAFGAPFEEAGEILASYKELVVTDESQIDTMKQARENRLTLKKIRTTVENRRKKLKEDSLRTGKAIDSVAKYIKDTIQPVETYLEEQEKYAEVKEAQRIIKLKNERIEMIQPYCDNPFLIDHLGEMSDEEFTKLFNEQKSAFELKKAQEEAYEREQQRIREEKEAEEARIREENEILRKQAEEREAEIEKEREDQRIIQEATDRQNQKAIDEERKKREAIENELQRKAEEEKRAKVAKENEDRQALLAPDKDKLLKIANDIEGIVLPALQNKDAQAVLDQVEGLLEKVTTYIRSNVKGL